MCKKSMGAIGRFFNLCYYSCMMTSTVALEPIAYKTKVVVLAHFHPNTFAE